MTIVAAQLADPPADQLAEVQVAEQVAGMDSTQHRPCLMLAWGWAITNRKLPTGMWAVEPESSGSSMCRSGLGQTIAAASSFLSCCSCCSRSCTTSSRLLPPPPCPRRQAFLTIVRWVTRACGIWARAPTAAIRSARVAQRHLSRLRPRPHRHRRRPLRLRPQRGRRPPQRTVPLIAMPATTTCRRYSG